MNDSRTAGTPATRGRQLPWHAVQSGEALERLEGRSDGLATDEAERRLEEHGPNRLPERQRAGPLRRLLGQFNNVLIYILLAAAAGTALLQLWVDAGVILGVVVVNAIIGFIQEGKAEKAIDAIRGMLSPKAMALRDGHRESIDAQLLVPGDVVFLTAGDRVPADLRLLSCKNLRIDEAILTGESEAVEKDAAPVDADAELGDRRSMAFSGTMVAYGNGKAVVVATGARSEIGRISEMLGEVEELTTPLLRQVALFGRWLSLAILLLAGLTFAFGYWVQGFEALDMFLAAVSIAVAAIPEGLPAIMTITLAIGVQRMAGRNAIIRRLPAVETLGSVTVVFSDKTGTLTRNEMTVRRVLTSDRSLDVTGVGYDPHGGFEVEGQDVEPREVPTLEETLRAILLCNDAQLWHEEDEWRLAGDPTEGALMSAALKGGMDAQATNESFPRMDVIPFDSGHKYMATLHHDHEGQSFVYLKGAPETVLDFCDRERTPEGDRELKREQWDERMGREAARGQRLLAVARKDAPPDERSLEMKDVQGGMTLLAVLGIIDPPRDEAVRAVADCQRAGILVKMITGDHAATAGAIAEQIGMDMTHDVVTGRQIEEMGDAELAAATRSSVFARASPEHKLRLVQAAQAQGHVVAMTGDGVNDAPALKRADVGVAMGIKGTEAAKEASEMVLADDNFASIAHSVEEGRTVYDNLRKSILFLLPTNGGQAFTIVAAVLLGLPLPLSPVQVLWVNMVTAVTLALALAFEPAEAGVMDRKPRDPSAPMLSGFLIWRVGFVSVLLVAGTFGHYLWMEETGVAVGQARTIAINTLVAGQLFYVLNSRYILEPSWGLRAFTGNRTVLVAMAVLVGLQLLFTYTEPMHYLFGTESIDVRAWMRAIAFGVFVFVAVELEKTFLRWRFGATLR
jgi:magnesium-transporting ATPase (P-type)